MPQVERRKDKRHSLEIALEVSFGGDLASHRIC